MMAEIVSLGRADARQADILLSGSTISAKHAQISRDPNGALQIKDMGSTNGTAIVRGGRKVAVLSAFVPLFLDDVLLLGDQSWEVREIVKRLLGNFKKPAETPRSETAAGVMRCTACGSITAKGKPCAHCGYRG